MSYREKEITTLSEETLKLEDGTQVPEPKIEPTKVKYVVAPTIYRLEVLVNAFLSSKEGQAYSLMSSGPQVFGHEEYVQAFVTYGDLF